MMETGDDDDDDDSITSSTNKSFMIREIDVEKAKSKLDEIWNDPPENAPSVDEDGDPKWGPVVLCDKITWEDFDHWLGVHEGDVRRWIFEPLSPPDDKYGRVLIYSIPADIHEATAGKIVFMIIKEVASAGNDIRLLRTIVMKASPTCQIAPQRGKEPDMSLSPAGLTIGGNIMDNGTGNPFPNLVIETAFKNESLNDLHQVIADWMLPQTSVQVAIGIKIFYRTRKPRRYLAILAVRNLPTEEVEFRVDVGEGPLTLAFPLERLYEGAPFPPALANLADPTVTIDLIALRDFLNTVTFP